MLQEIPSHMPSATIWIYTQVNTTEEVLEDTLVLTSHSLYLLSAGVDHSLSTKTKVGFHSAVISWKLIPAFYNPRIKNQKQKGIREGQMQELFYRNKRVQL